MFEDSKNIPLKQLSYWQKGITEDKLKFNTQRVAEKFDEVVKTIPTISYKNNFDKESVVTKLSEFFTNGENTVNDLSNFINEFYKVSEPQ